MLKIIDNPDPGMREIAENGLFVMEYRYGKRYCPCSAEQTEDTLCPCKQFREQDTPGECHCGRYAKIEVEEETDE